MKRGTDPGKISQQLELCFGEEGHTTPAHPLQAELDSALTVFFRKPQISCGPFLVCTGEDVSLQAHQPAPQFQRQPSFRAVKHVKVPVSGHRPRPI